MDKKIEPVTENLDSNNLKDENIKKFLENFTKMMNAWTYHQDEYNPFLSHNKSGFTEFLCDVLIACLDHNYIYDDFRIDNTPLEDLKDKYALVIKEEGKLVVPLNDGTLKVNLDKENNNLKIEFYNLEKKLVSSNSFFVKLKDKEKDKDKEDKEEKKGIYKTLKDKYFPEKIKPVRVSMNDGEIKFHFEDGKLNLNLNEKEHILEAEFKNSKKDIFLSEKIEFGDPLKSNSSWKDKINDDKSNDQSNEMEK